MNRRTKKNYKWIEIAIAVWAVVLAFAIAVFAADYTSTHQNIFSLKVTSTGQVEISPTSEGDGWLIKAYGVNGTCGDTSTSVNFTITNLTKKSDGTTPRGVTFKVTTTSMNSNATSEEKTLDATTTSISFSATSSSSRSTPKEITIRFADIVQESLGVNVVTTVKPGVGGTITVDGEEVTAQEDFTNPDNYTYALTAEADEGYKFYGWMSSEGALTTDGAESYSYAGKNTATLWPLFIKSDSAMYIIKDANPVMYYGFLNDAIAAANGSGTIVVIQDGTMYDSTGATDITIPKDVTLLVPYSDTNYTIQTTTQTSGTNSKLEHANYALSTSVDLGSNEQYSQSAATYDNKVLNPKHGTFRTFTIPENSTLNIAGGGKMVIGGTIVAGTYGTTGITGGVFGAHANVVIEKDAELNVLKDATSGKEGILSVCGYILGEGTVNVTGGKLYQPFTILDYMDGSNTANCQPNGTFPTVRYALLGVQTTMIVSQGGSMHGYIVIYTTAFLTNPAQYNVTCQPIVGPSGLLTLADGATMTATYDSSNVVTYDATIGRKDKLVGYDYIPWVGKSTITIDGGASVGSLDITVTIKKLTSTENITVYSSDVDFPVPYNFDFVLQGNNSVYEISNHLMLLPGCNMTVEDGATLKVASGKRFTVFDGLRDYRGKMKFVKITSDNGPDESGNYPNGTTYNLSTYRDFEKNCNYFDFFYPGTADLQAAGWNGMANLIVNGSFTVDGSFGGYIQTNGTGTVTMNGTPSSSAAVGNILKHDAANDHSAGRTVRTLNAWLYDVDGNRVALKTGDKYYGGSLTTNTADSYSYTLYYDKDNTGETVSITESLDGAVEGNWTENEYITVTFAPVDGVSYSVNGIDVPAEGLTFENQKSNTKYAIAVNSANYYLLNSIWADGNGNTGIAHADGEDKYSFGVTSTVTPTLFYSEDGVKPFLVNGVGYWTWETAFDAATAGSTVVLAKDYTLPSDLAGNGLPADGTYVRLVNGKISYTIPNGVNFLVPYDDGDYVIDQTTASGEGRTGRFSWIHANHGWASCVLASGEHYNDSVFSPTTLEPYEGVFRTLTIPANVTVNVSGGSKMAIGGTIVSGTYSSSGVQAGVTGPHANVVIEKNGELNVQSDSNGKGILSVCGYILGEGKVNVTGGTVYQPFTILDYLYGQADMALAKNQVMPTLRYAMLSIQAPMTISGGGEMYGYTDTMFGGHKAGLVKIVGTDGLLILAEDATMTTSYNANSTANVSKSINNGTVGYMYYDRVGKMTITIDGGASLGSMALEMVYVTHTTSNNELPVPYHFDFDLQNGTYNIDNHLALLPGVNMYVAEGANLVVSSGIRFTVFDGFRDYTMDHNFTDPAVTGVIGTPDTDGNYPNGTAYGKVNNLDNFPRYMYPATVDFLNKGFNAMANLVVDGTLTVDGSFGGYVQTNGTGTVVMNGTPSSTAAMGNLWNDAGDGNGEYAGKTERTLGAWIYNADGTLVAMETGKTYSAVDAGTHTISNYTYKLYYTTADFNATKTITESLGADIKGSWKPIVAKIGDTEYSTIEEALEDARGTGKTIELLADISDKITVSQEVTIEKGVYNADIVAGGGYEATTEGTIITIKLVKVVLDALSLDIKDEIQLNFYFYIPENYQGGTFVVSEQSNNVVTYEEFVTIDVSTISPDAKGRYKVSRGIAAGEMTGEVTVKFQDQDGTAIAIYDSQKKEPAEVEKVTRTVRDFADLVLAYDVAAVEDELTKAKYVALQNMCEAMLVFGGEAQKRFNTGHADSASEGMGSKIAEYTQLDHTKLLSATAEGSIGISAYSQRVNLDSNAYLRVYFTIGANDSMDNYTFQVEKPTDYGRQTTIDINPNKGHETVGGMRYGYVDIYLPPAYWNNTCTITANDSAGNTYVVKTGVMSWVRNCLAGSTSTDAEKTMAAAMYYYSDFADKYFDAKLAAEAAE